MTGKRFTNIEHDYENAWIKCNDDGDFMIYAIYKELDESLPSLEDLLNGLAEENQCLRELLDIGKTNAKDIVDVLNAQQNRIKELDKENKELKSLCKTLITYIEKNSIAFVIDEATRRLLDD